MVKNSSEATPATAFERFKDLTRKLIKVPKEELDAKLEEEKARKATPLIDQKAV